MTESSSAAAEIGIQSPMNMKTVAKARRSSKHRILVLRVDSTKALKMLMLFAEDRVMKSCAV